MSLPLYMDVHVRRAVTLDLRLRALDVLTAQQDGAGEMDDPQLLDRAMKLGRVIFTQDDDFLVEVARRREIGVSFASVIYAHQLNVSVRECIDGLELFLQNSFRQRSD